MQVVFLSSVLNHHSLPLALALSEMQDVEFFFVATMQLTEERQKLGYQGFNDLYDFVIPAYESEAQQERAKALCLSCDVLIYGGAPFFYVKKRLAQNKLTFRYSERLYKNVPPVWQMFPRKIKMWWKYGRKSNCYLLGASAYAATDYAKSGAFRGKAYRWGYFPQVKKYDDADALIQSKSNHSLMWAGRFLDWKHPDMPVYLAARLKAEGYDFHLSMVGTGVLLEEIKALATKLDVDDRVTFTGSMSPDAVREQMEQSEIYLFTSDRNEGWGAVLNEAMNSACAVVASHAIGAVPFLISENENGMIYQDGNFEHFYGRVKWLLDRESERKAIAKNAYQTMTGEWSPENAARKLMALVTELLKNPKKPFFCEKGVCSRAEIIGDDWYVAE